ncbi:hypothetical protein K470DRAFT_214617 [Piedraia hortae CBS 480.64]|uniref:ER transporter 6TM N-terminal domain-containing protein n=1 Tax=Piedraia hortae CBS 480.64 TaxID=1314780 RepID=A0A6A7C4I6_9PEZI|nr:hypothetical protein K470DRAFT_214617 [Piedraia hortae CBS 480.64]
MQMFKGALAPTIATAAYQASAYANTFTTIGYLVGVMTILSMAVLPRARFLQVIVLGVICTCISAAFCLLALFCVVKARQNTAGPHDPPRGYNSSASAVSGVWLFALIYAISAFRCKNPQFNLASLQMIIFANVAAVYGARFATMIQAQAFIRRMLLSFLSGQAIAAGVSLFIFPFSSRQIVFKIIPEYLSTIQAVVSSHLDYLHSLEDVDAFALHRINTAGEEDTAQSAEAKYFHTKVNELSALHAQLGAELPFAKREISLGKMGPDNLESLFKHLRLIMLPTVSLGSIQQVFLRVGEERGWDLSADFSHVEPDMTEDESDRKRAQAVQEWNTLMKQLRTPFNQITQTINDGIQHVAIVLHIDKHQKARNDDNLAEQGKAHPQPGDGDFARHYDNCTREFLNSKKEMLRTWCKMHNIQLPADFFEDPARKGFRAPEWMNLSNESPERKWLRLQLFLCLYLEFLLYNISREVLKLIMFADALRTSGKLERTHLIVPGYKRLRKWLICMFSDQGEQNDDQQVDQSTGGVTVNLGEAYKQKNDLEHLPPQSKWERAGNLVRKVAQFLKSPASLYGLRVACATTSVAMVSYLRDTQTIYNAQRFFWAQIVVGMCMNPSAGQTLLAFIFQILGTTSAMMMGVVAWYIVDGHTAGILVFFFLFLHVGVYIMLRYPKYVSAGIIFQVTLVIIVGYELQVKKQGLKAATSNGQIYHPIYVLGPIRLATVAVGCFVAWIWTMFPYPNTEHSQIRQSTGSTLYLLAKYYTLMYETLRVRLRGPARSAIVGPEGRLNKSRLAVFGKFNSLMAALRRQMGYLQYDLSIGGKFPKDEYNNIIELMQSAANFMALVTIASGAFADADTANDRENTSRWRADFHRIVAEVDVFNHQIIMLLSLFSATIATGSPLPPYLQVPEPYQLSKRLDEIDEDILSVRHIAEPGYSAFAVIQLATRCMIDDVRLMLATVKKLAGEMDFSLHVAYMNRSESSVEEEGGKMGKEE